MIAERSMGVRALAATILPPPGTPFALRADMQNALRLVNMPTDQDDLKTLPPSAPPPGAYTDTVVDDLLATAKRLEEHYKTLLDPEGLLTQQTAHISALINANYGLIHEQVRGLVKAVDAVVIRVGQVETSQETSADRLQRMELDMAAMRHQVDRMDAELVEMKRALATGQQQ